MPDFEHYDLALVWGQRCQSIYCMKLGFGLVIWLLEPKHRCVFTFEPSPETAPVIDGTIPISAHYEPFGVHRRRFEAHQGDESVMQYILGLRVSEAEGSPVENQSSSSILVELLTPQ